MDRLINKNTYDLLFKDIDNLPEIESNSYQNLVTWRTIDYFTRINQFTFFENLIILYNNDNIKLNRISFNKKINKYQYKYKDKVITFDKISNYLEGEEFNKKLLSNDRLHDCVIGSLSLSQIFDNSKITTGYIVIDNKKMLHHVVELENKSKTYILDYTKNLYIEKEDYVKITNFIELSSLSGKEILDNLEIINLISSNFSLKFYLTFTKEILNDIEKNKFIFDKKRILTK